jgi:hypothetical protein
MPSSILYGFRRRFLTGLAVVTLLQTGATSSPAGDHPPSQVVVEVGYAHPYGDLADDFTTTVKGLGIKEGLEIGFRWRYHFSESLSLSPSFHFVDYKNLKGENSEVGAWRIKPTTLLYGLELMYVLRDPEATLRPFFGGSLALCRNRVEGYYKTWEQAFDSSVNTWGLGARAGLVLGQFEFSAVYNLNRFDTWRFFNTGYEEGYIWDNLVVRVGWIIPFGK